MAVTRFARFATHVEFDTVGFVALSVLMIILGTLASSQGLVIVGVIYLLVGLARVISPAFKRWSDDRNLIVVLSFLLLFLYVLYQIWEGPVPT